MLPISKLIERIIFLSKSNNRIIIAVAGPPAAGKSTFVNKLAEEFNDIVTIPMDGFHLDNDILEQRNLLSRKGSPESFDATGYIEVLKRIKRANEIVYTPSFDRQADLSRSAAIEVPTEAKIILAEGNYLLLDHPPWNHMNSLFDVTVFLDVPMNMIRDRLLERWTNHGFTHSEALAKAETNDIPNAELVLQQSKTADFIVPNY